jgi:hypothetical protein
MHGDGRVFRRGRLWWIVYFRNGREYRESSGSADQDVAQRLLRERLSAAGTDVLTIRGLVKRPQWMVTLDSVCGTGPDAADPKERPQGLSPVKTSYVKIARLLSQ